MLFISHDLNVIQYIADRVAVMYAGKIMELGAVRQIFERPLHPYTKGLVASNMSLGFRNDKGHQLKGEIVSAHQSRERLPPRIALPDKVERCEGIEPLLQEKTSGQQVACHEI
jgi:oligopeptide/dipeptide ABC transporter ATP-binding protein